MAPGLRIELLGHFRVTYVDQPVLGIHARQQELLAYLILNRHRAYPRQQIASLFWPESTDSQALTNLRRELHALRRALPQADRVLSIGSGELQWRDVPSFTCDVCEFEAASTRCDFKGLQEAARLYQGDLLPECYQDWITPARERLRSMLVDALRKLTSALEERRAYSDAIQFARRLVALDTLDEEAHRSIMRLCALQGDRAGALRAYQTCAALLERELAVEPSPAIRADFERLRAAEELVSPLSEQTVALPLIGRQEEWARLLATWSRAARGQAQMVLIRGEAGIGKTRLAEELAHWCNPQGIAVATARSYAIEGRLAYAPVTEWLRSRAVKSTLSGLDVVWLSEVARLLPELMPERPDLPQPGPLRETWQRQRLFEALARAFLHAPQPLLLIFDDMRWSDPDTLGWLHYLVRNYPDSRLLVVGTVRTEEVSENSALSELAVNLRQLDRVLEIDLGPLDEAETAALAAHVVQRTLDPDTAAFLFRRTEGHPLFALEMARADLSGRSSLPLKVQGFIATRLSRLSQPAREIVHLAATVGRDFSYDVLREAGDLEEKALVKVLDEIWQHRIVREKVGRRYDFSHDLVREVAYAGISPATCRLLHERVARALELVHASNLDAVSAHVADHCEKAGQTERAIPYWSRAGRKSLAQSAIAEAITQLRQGLALVATLRDGLARARQELELQMAIGPALIATAGFASPQVEQTYARAHELCTQVGDAPELLGVLSGLRIYYLLRGKLDLAAKLGDQFAALAAPQRSPALDVIVLAQFAITRYFRGEMVTARAHMEQALDLYDRTKPDLVSALSGTGIEFGLSAYFFSAHALWYLGYPEQAVTRMREAWQLAQQLARPASVANVLDFDAWLHVHRREPEVVRQRAEADIALSKEQGLSFFVAHGTIFRGWALVEQGHVEEGLEQLQEGLTAYRATGAEIERAHFLGLLAEAQGKHGRVAEGLRAIDEAMSDMETDGAAFCHAELYRVKGELLLMQHLGETAAGPSTADEAERCLRLATEIARRQQAKSLELRAAIGLARLWQQQGRLEAAHQLLAGIYNWFTEGFDTPDLREARELLGHLALTARV